MATKRKVSLSCALRQLVQQHLRLLQVGGVETLGEPVVDRGEEIAGCASLASVPGRGRFEPQSVLDTVRCRTFIKYREERRDGWGFDSVPL